MATHVVVAGNPVDGFRFIGPIAHPDIEDAERLADGDEWWLAKLEPAPDETLEELTAEARALGFTAGDLDEDVHDAAAGAASAANNGGLERQVAFLVEQLGAAEVARMLVRR